MQVRRQDRKYALKYFKLIKRGTGGHPLRRILPDGLRYEHDARALFRLARDVFRKVFEVRIARDAQAVIGKSLRLSFHPACDCL